MSHSIYDPPEWFDLEKYREVEEFNSVWWALELQKRNDQKEAFSILKENLSSGAIAEYEKLGPFRSSSIFFQVPIKEKEFEDFWPVCHWFEKFMIGMGQSRQPIRELTFYDLGFLVSEAKRGYENEWEAFQGGDWGKAGTEFLNKDVNHIVDYQMKTGPCETSLVISLAADDKQIIETVKNMLPALREKRKREPLSRESVTTVLRKLKDERILPHIDLRLWEMATGIKITYNQLSSWLFPDRPDIGEETIRKHQKYIDLALDEHFPYRILYSLKEDELKQQARGIFYTQEEQEELS